MRNLSGQKRQNQRDSQIQRGIGEFQHAHRRVFFAHGLKPPLSKIMARKTTRRRRRRPIHLQADGRLAPRPHRQTDRDTWPEPGRRRPPFAAEAYPEATRRAAESVCLWRRSARGRPLRVSRFLQTDCAASVPSAFSPSTEASTHLTMKSGFCAAPSRRPRSGRFPRVWRRRRIRLPQEPARVHPRSYGR